MRGRKPLLLLVSGVALAAGAPLAATSTTAPSKDVAAAPAGQCPVDDRREANKAVIMRHVNEAIGQRKFDVWNEIMDPAYELHHPLIKPGREGYRAASEMFWSAFSKPTYEIHHVLAQGDMVMIHYTEKATQTGPMFGVQPGRSYTKEGFALYRLENCKMREGWIREDDLGFIQQLGIKLPEN